MRYRRREVPTVLNGDGSTAWTPAKANLDGALPTALWIKADRITGLSDADPITSGPNASPSTAVPVAQSDATKKPLYKTNILNGKPGILFDNSNDCLQYTIDLSAHNQVTIFILCMSVGVGATGVLMDYGAGDAGSFAVFRNVDNKMYTIHTTDAGSKISNLAMTRPVVAGVPTLFTFTHDLTLTTNENTGYFDGIAGSTIPRNDNCTGNFGNKTFNIGSRGDGASLPSNAYIFEILVYPGVVMSDAGRQQVEDYLRSEWMPNALAADFADNAYTAAANMTGGGTFIEASPASRLVYTTEAETLYLNLYNNIFGTYPLMTDIGVRVDGVDVSTVEPGAAGVVDKAVALGVGAKTVEIINGLQSKPTTLIGSWIRRAVFNKTATKATPTATPRILVYGDSIAVGANADNPSLEGWAQLVRNDYEGSLMLEAWGYRALFDDGETEGARTTFAAAIAALSPAIIWLAIGTNDYGDDKWSSANFGTAYADFLDKLHAALPSATIYCQTPIERTTETERTAGWGNLGAYRTQIGTAVSTRGPWAVLVDGTGASFPQAPGDLSDGVHPTTTSHAAYAAAVETVLGIS